jgi:NAD(P)-dependent dehydrogenase (short-subunit alcohol dehydrogenase family)
LQQRGHWVRLLPTTARSVSTYIGILMELDETMAGSARRIVLITGGAKRIGREIALALGNGGWDVAVHFRDNEDAARQTVELLQSSGARACALGADLAHENDAAQLLGRVAELLGEPDAVVNNASRFEYDDAAGFSYAHLTTHMDVNVAAPVILARCLHERRTRHAGNGSPRAGVVVNLLDQKLYNYNPDYLSYTLSKAALEAATVMLAQALAPHVRVVGIAPGITLPSGGQTEDGFRRAHERTPLGRSSTPADLASAISFVLDSDAITGTTIVVDGGQHLAASGRDVMFTTKTEGGNAA